MLHDLFDTSFIEAGKRRRQVVHGYGGICCVLFTTDSFDVYYGCIAAGF
jgi:hypothetical protein